MKIPEIVIQAIAANTAISNEAIQRLPEFKYPVRLGVLLDELTKLQDKFGNLRLTEREREIIDYLQTANRPVTKNEMLEKIWNYSSEMDTNTIETHIYRLRGKLEKAFGKEIIITENGHYKLIEN